MARPWKAGKEETQQNRLDRDLSEKGSNGNHHLIDKEEEETPTEIMEEEEEETLEEDHPEEDRLQTMALTTNLMMEEALDSR